MSDLAFDVRKLKFVNNDACLCCKKSEAELLLKLLMRSLVLQ